MGGLRFFLKHKKEKYKENEKERKKEKKKERDTFVFNTAYFT